MFLLTRPNAGNNPFFFAVCIQMEEHMNTQIPYMCKAHTPTPNKSLVYRTSATVTGSHTMGAEPFFSHAPSKSTFPPKMHKIVTINHFWPFRASKVAFLPFFFSRLDRLGYASSTYKFFMFDTNQCCVIKF